MTEESVAPADDELLELVEKQDLVMDCLLQKLQMCQDKVKLLSEVEVKRQESEQEAKAIMESAQQKVINALTAVDMLQGEKEKLEKELDDMRGKIGEKPVASVIQLRNRIKELEFDLLREQRSSDSLQMALNFEKSRTEQLQKELDESNSARKAEMVDFTSKMEGTLKETSELRAKCQSLLDDRERVESELGSELQFANEQSTHLRAYCDRLLEEITKLRKECKVAECRLATLIEENAVLRGKVMSGNQELDEENVGKILKDQSHLISALKEEGKLLMQKLVSDRKENKNRLKTLKEENRELADRLQNLLSL